MLKIEITGTKHPKAITVFTDDDEAELAMLNDPFADEEFEFSDDPLHMALGGASRTMDGWSFIVEGKGVSDACDLWGDAFPQFEEALAKLQSQIAESPEDGPS